MTGFEPQTSGIESDLLSYFTFWREKSGANCIKCRNDTAYYVEHKIKISRLKYGAD